MILFKKINSYHFIILCDYFYYKVHHEDDLCYIKQIKYVIYNKINMILYILNGKFLQLLHSWSSKVERLKNISSVHSTSNISSDIERLGINFKII